MCCFIQPKKSSDFDHLHEFEFEDEDESECSLASAMISAALVAPPNWGTPGTASDPLRASASLKELAESSSVLPVICIL